MRKYNHDTLKKLHGQLTRTKALLNDPNGMNQTTELELNRVIFELNYVIGNESADVTFDDLGGGTFFRFDKSAMSTVYYKISRDEILRFSYGKLTNELDHNDMMKHNVIELNGFELSISPRSKDEDEDDVEDEEDYNVPF